MRVLHRLVLLTLVAFAASLPGCKNQPAQTSSQTAPAAPPAAPGDGAAAAEAPPTAQPSAPADAAPAAMIDKPLLWAATKNGKTVHILGTMHMGVDASEQLPPWVWQRFEEAEILVVEIDLATVGPKAQAALMRSDGTTLEDELGPEHWAKLKDAVGMMAGPLKQMKAFGAISWLLSMWLPPTPPMDSALIQRAAAAGKELVALETLELQMALVDRHMTIDALKAMLDDSDTARAALRDLLAAYTAGDEAALIAQGTEPAHWYATDMNAKDFATLLDEFLYARNRAWIPQIEAAMARGDTFVAVGALHVVGEQGVVALLEQEGYATERLTAPTK